MPDAAAERQPADAGGADDPDRNGQPRLVRDLDELAEQRAAADAYELRRRVHRDVVDLRDVDDETVVDAPEAGAVVAARADRDPHAVLVRELHRRRDVRR